MIPEGTRKNATAQGRQCSCVTSRLGLANAGAVAPQLPSQGTACPDTARNAHAVSLQCLQKPHQRNTIAIALRLLTASQPSFHCRCFVSSAKYPYT
mmetsp:Transcript_24484/g.38742  ORF Transcript_24484/g.38742 Transcript_24484/m.38742 type:complete len:96 (-) Transcript_24484:562-849(-)